MSTEDNFQLDFHVHTTVTWKDEILTSPAGSIGWKPLSNPATETPSAPMSLEHGDWKDDCVAV